MTEQNQRWTSISTPAIGVTRAAAEGHRRTHMRIANIWRSMIVGGQGDSINTGGDRNRRGFNVTLQHLCFRETENAKDRAKNRILQDSTDDKAAR